MKWAIQTRQFCRLGCTFVAQMQQVRLSHDKINMMLETHFPIIFLFFSQTKELK